MVMLPTPVVQQVVADPLLSVLNPFWPVDTALVDLSIIKECVQVRQ